VFLLDPTIQGDWKSGGRLLGGLRTEVPQRGPGAMPLDPAGGTWRRSNLEEIKQRVVGIRGKAPSPETGVWDRAPRS